MLKYTPREPNESIFIVVLRPMDWQGLTTKMILEFYSRVPAHA